MMFGILISIERPIEFAVNSAAFPITPKNPNKYSQPVGKYVLCIPYNFDGPS